MDADIDFRKLLSYSSETGIFVWIVNTGSKVRKGMVAGTIKTNRYVEITYNGRKYKAHRLAWLFVFGKFPSGDIDHINHKRCDNRISNLRDVCRRENCRNKSLSSRNSSGVTGVSFCKRAGRWCAGIGVNNKRISLGYFTSKREAVIAREAAEVVVGFHKNHGK